MEGMCVGSRRAISARITGRRPHPALAGSGETPTEAAESPRQPPSEGRGREGPRAQAQCGPPRAVAASRAAPQARDGRGREEPETEEEAGRRRRRGDPGSGAPPTGSCGDSPLCVSSARSHWKCFPEGRCVPRRLARRLPSPAVYIRSSAAPRPRPRRPSCARSPELRADEAAAAAASGLVIRWSPEPLTGEDAASMVAFTSGETERPHRSEGSAGAKLGQESCAPGAAGDAPRAAGGRRLHPPGFAFAFAFAAGNELVASLGPPPRGAPAMSSPRPGCFFDIVKLRGK
ncbi:protein FAM246C-like [Myotis daubentonii]|uniref:protein FAM246C-like n=1 Tax=Myotis daubentonii TaxID=98922 RepID=UPI002872AEE8|nr:protein FAM246C-like [Myotis daubentonii]